MRDRQSERERDREMIHTKYYFLSFSGMYFPCFEDTVFGVLGKPSTLGMVSTGEI